MSADVDFLKEKRDFFFYANRVEEDVYACIPQAFGQYSAVVSDNIRLKPVFR